MRSQVLAYGMQQIVLGLRGTIGVSLHHPPHGTMMALAHKCPIGSGRN
jgi:hypothetical protein